MNKIGCVELASYEATGKNGSDEFTFAAGAPPGDGSVGLAFLTIDPAFGEFSVSGNPTQKLVVFEGGSVQGNINIHPTAGANFAGWLPVGWRFVVI